MTTPRNGDPMPNTQQNCRPVNHKAAGFISHGRQSSSPYLSCSAVIGSKQTLKEGLKEIRPPRRSLKYDPTHKWWEPPLSAWVPQLHREIIVAIWIYNVVIVFLARFTNLCGSPRDVKDARFCSEDFMLHEDMDLRVLSFGLFLLLSFRANQAYNRFWEGRKALSSLRKVYDFSRLVCAHVNVKSQDDFLDRRRAVYFTVAFTVACKLHLRGQRDISRDFKELGIHHFFSPQDMANLQNAEHMPMFCQDILSSYLEQQVETGNLSHKQLNDINKTCLAVMSASVGNCERIIDTPVPLSYVLLLRFYLLLWLILYPLHGAEYYGWWAIVVSNLVSYAVWGLESMVCEIEHPFGFGRSGLDLDSMTKEYCQGVRAILERAESRHRDCLFDRLKVESIVNAEGRSK